MALSLVSVLLLGLFLISSLISLYRGFHETDWPALGWSHGYHDSLNSLRLFKSFLVALLLTPLLVSALRKTGSRALEYFAVGAAIGLGGAALAVIWERAAFTDLLDFSSDYRATGLFWEMHVGGAALDGFLALTLPFVIWVLLRADSILRQIAALGLLMLAGYACLTTFSRGLYAAALVSLVVLALLRLRQQSRSLSAARGAILIAVIVFAVAVPVSVLAFRSGGYRTLAAVLAAFVVSLSQARVARRARGSHWVVAIGIGIFLAALSYGVAPLISKGPYVLFAIAASSCIALALYKPAADSDWLPPIALGGYIWVLISAAMVALHWGGETALRDSVIALSMLFVIAVWNASTTKPLLPQSLRHQSTLVGSVALVAATVAVLAGGAYMGGRFATTESDFAGRIQHWRHGLGLLNEPLDWVFGKGFGRFPASYFFGVPDTLFPGSYRLSDMSQNASVLISGPRHPIDFGELFRLSQRIAVAPGTYTVILDARAKDESQLHVEICEKHLLYSAGCAIRHVVLKPTIDWQRLVVPLDGKGLSRGSQYAPRLAFFSLAVGSNGRLIEIDNVSVIGAAGQNLIENGDFSHGMARWFFTSDRYHLPWHIKNVFLNVLFDQGAAGLVLFVSLVTGALWRVVQGSARSHPFAPFVAASLSGFLVVGAFDSLLDVPRVAFLFYLILSLALMLRPFSPTIKNSA